MRKIVITIILIGAMVVATALVAVAATDDISIFSDGFKSEATDLGELPESIQEKIQVKVQEKLQEISVIVAQAKEQVELQTERLSRDETKTVAEATANQEAKSKAKSVAREAVKAEAEAKGVAVAKKDEMVMSDVDVVLKANSVKTAGTETKAGNDMAEETATEEIKTEVTKNSDNKNSSSSGLGYSDSSKVNAETESKEEKEEIESEAKEETKSYLDSITYDEIMSADNATKKKIARLFSSSEEYSAWLEQKKKESGVKTTVVSGNGGEANF